MEDAFRNRKDMRKPLVLAAKCRTMSGMRDEGVLSDISTHGCCITTRALLFRVGSRILIKPDGIEAIAGVIRWMAGNRAGVEFDQPLYPAVVEHLSQHNQRRTAVGIHQRVF